MYPLQVRGTTAGPAERLDEDLLGSVAEKARQSRDANARFFGEQGPVLVAAAKALAETYRRGGRLFPIMRFRNVVTLDHTPLFSL